MGMMPPSDKKRYSEMLSQAFPDHTIRFGNNPEGGLIATSAAFDTPEGFRRLSAACATFGCWPQRVTMHTVVIVPHVTS